MRNGNAAHDARTAIFQGELIVCNSLSDAVAVNTANDIFAKQSAYDYSAGELYRLAAVLRCYGRINAAEALVRLTAKMRAAHLLFGFANCEQPKQ